jgi:hypothetical protein
MYSSLYMLSANIKVRRIKVYTRTFITANIAAEDLNFEHMYADVKYMLSSMYIMYIIYVHYYVHYMSEYHKEICIPYSRRLI